MTFPRLRKMVEESGVENLAQIYTAVKYTRESHEAFSQKVLAYLQAQSFMNNGAMEKPTDLPNLGAD